MPTKIELTLEQSQQGVSNEVLVTSEVNTQVFTVKMEILLEPTSNKLLDKTTVLQPHSSEVGFINHMLILKLSKAQVDQGSQIKMIQVKEMMQDNDLKNSKSKDKGSKSRSQSMDEQSHYKQDKTITRQSINVKRHIFNVIGGTEEFEERDLNIGGDYRLSKRKFGIVYHGKVVRIPLKGDEILRVHGERTQGVVKILMNTKVVEFLVDLVPRATPVMKSPYRLAPLEMQELSEQLQELQDEVVDALSRKERVKPRRVRAMAMTIQYGVRGMKLAVQSEAFKQENVLAERLHGLD
ncbi:hypothetical protein Tco_1321157 [Tanacetum coccineum]